MAPDPIDPAEARSIATDLATEAAALLVDGLSRVRASIETKSSGTDMVTEMDRASERLIVEGILRLRPHDAIVGEEGTDRPGSSGVRWIIDPLDGTTNYVYAHAGFAVSIAVAVDDEVVAGAVVDPLHGDTFSAHRAGGATRNEAAIRCGTERDPARALVGTGFSYDPERRRRQAAVVLEVLPTIRDIRRMGAAAVDLCSVACGRLDAFYEKGLERWDYAAGALIASEAGATVGDLDGGDASSAFTLAANEALFEPLRSRLAAAGAAQA